MKNAWMAVVCLGVLFLCCSAALCADDIASRRFCENCGMDRQEFGYARMLVRFADGSQVGTCSLHCAVVELEKRKRQKLQAILVADRDSRELIDAAEATWVMGGSKRGVMTRRPKWAFARKSAAEEFVKQHGGTLLDWQSAYRAGQADAAR
ncbi:nitrous oxide reductase accessory protein NosL [Geomonas subterranea]|uniref:Nitrous oxide reductase accessory protein NosL n=1 Tax=Geomonas subterranea TaxID=2847989 RepID=A0ABX8LME9_9BACT|nr:nitrous oxide reductase accessory protein NosL [Geomonas subterranea]QXE91403.1 nitrous oxide reductase accessory protein NosL [Geomonas subterranea]QXM10509.1 nitrous oxide reductase accessory protein NosL [Geomonas subterranea]